MKSFQNFADTIIEAEEKTRQRVNLSPEILPMQPEGETAPSKPSAPKKKVSKIKTGTKKPAGDKAEAIKKGYVSPEGRVQERGVVTNRIRAGALGYGDVGKDPSKYGINPAEVSKEKTTLFARATSPLKPERKAARKEIKTAVKSIEKRYPGATERTGTSFRGFSRSVSSPKPSPQDISTLQRMARPETSLKSAQSLSVKLGGTGAGKRAQAASDAAKDIKNYEKQIGFHQRVMQAVRDLPPEPTLSKPTKKSVVKPSSVTLSLTRPEVPKVSKGPSLSVSTPKPQPSTTFKSKPSFYAQQRKLAQTAASSVKPAATSTVDDIASAATKVMKQMNADRAAEKAQKALKTAKTWRATGGVLGIAGAGLEAKSGYEQARKEGAGKKRAFGAGAARALGGLTGGAIGSVVGTGLGLPGAIGGGIAGYKYGADAGTAAYKALTGDYGKKVTTQSVLSNVRKTVPYSIRSQVPAGTRKAFRDLVTQTGRAYGQWSRSQGGNK